MTTDERDELERICSRPPDTWDQSHRNVTPMRRAGDASPRPTTADVLAALVAFTSNPGRIEWEDETIVRGILARWETERERYIAEQVELRRSIASHPSQQDARS